MTTTETIIQHDEIDPGRLSATDLRKEAKKILGATAHVLVLQGRAERVEVLVCREAGRAGVAWGADATWIDLRPEETAEDAARIVLTDADETERRA